MTQDAIGQTNIDLVHRLHADGWTNRNAARKVASSWSHVFTIRDGWIAALVAFSDRALFARAYRGNSALSPAHTPGGVS